MQRKHNSSQQTGWNCFDVAVGVDRDKIVAYALLHKEDESIRLLLAPEIRHAAAITVTHMNLQPEKNKDQTLPRGILPESMRTEHLRNLVNSYLQANDKMIAAVATCNTALGYNEGKRLPLVALDLFFKDEDKKSAHAQTYTAYKKKRDQLFKPHEDAFQAYCESVEAYECYIRDYYGKQEWVAFQRCASDEASTSIIDIVAKMISVQIVIYQLEETEYKEIYRTSPYGETIKHIEYQNNSHFIELNIGLPVIGNVITEFDTVKKTSSTSNHALSVPPGKELLLSRGFAGSIYQVKILMLFAFEAFRKKQRFHLYTEAQGFGKFDDAVLFLEDKMQIIQVKHSFDPKGEYVLKQLVGDPTSKTDGNKNKSDRKKAVISKYFDSWLMIESMKQCHLSTYNDAIEYIFITNHSLNVEDGLSEIYDESTGRFTNCLLAGPTENAKQEQARKAILNSLYAHLKNMQAEILQACQKLVNIFNGPIVNLGKSKGAVNIAASSICATDKVLLALLLEQKCIEIDSSKGTFRKNNFYKFTENWVLSSHAKTLPPVLQYLRNKLFARAEFSTIEKKNSYYFITASSAFSDLNKSASKTSSVNAALSTGYFGPAQHNLLSTDLTNVTKTTPLDVLPSIRDFFEQFKFKVEQPNEAEMTKVLEAQIGEHFNISDNGFYRCFYEHMLDFLLASSGDPITDENVEELFETARTELKRNRLIGHSQRYEYHLSRECNINLNRNSSSQIVDSFLKNKKSIMVCYSSSDWLAAMTICSELQTLRDDYLKEDSYGFIDANFAVLEEDQKIFDVVLFKLLIIDHALFLTNEQLHGFIEKATRTSKKLMLLCSNKIEMETRLAKMKGITDIDELFTEIKLLSIDTIQRNLKAKATANEGVIIGSRFVAFNTMGQGSSYYEVMKSPYHLAAMLKQAIKEPVSKAYTTPRLFVKPSLVFQEPVYRAEAVLNINFPMIHFSNVNLSAIQQIFTLDLDKFSKVAGQTSLKTFIEQEEKDKRPQPEALVIKHTAAWDKLNINQQKELTHFKLIFINEDVPNNLGTPLRLLSHSISEGNLCFKLANQAMFQYMPNTVEYVADSETLYDDDLAQKTPYPYRRVILSDYGSGKTYLTEKLLLESQSTFNWIVRIAMKTLSLDMRLWSLGQLAEYYLNVGTLEVWQRDLLQHDIKNGEIFWVLDGFDEILPEQRDALKELINLLVTQPNCLVTSRPSAAAFIPLQPNQFIALKPFGTVQINEFVKGFFSKDEELQKKATTLIERWQATNSLSLLGKPLMCRIACEIIADNGTNLLDLNDITLAKLYDYFMQVNFKKYQHDHNRVALSRLTGKRIYHMSMAMIERLKKVTFAKLFPARKHVMILPDAILDADIRRLGLVSNIEALPATAAAHYIFDHQTQVEYFAALYWVEQLLLIPSESRIEHVKAEWSDELFNIDLRVVWQFVAGIVSTSDNIFLDGNSLEAFDAFCAFMLDSSEDLVGTAYQDLLYCCYQNMQHAALETSSYGARFKIKASVVKSSYVTDDILGEIKVFKAQGRRVKSAEQIVQENAYRKLLSITDIKNKLPDELEKRIRGYLQAKDPILLEKLFEFKKYLSQSNANPELITNIKDKMLAIYAAYGDKSVEYMQSYALLTFMLDHNLIELNDCVAVFTQDFKQKDCVLDVVRRLNQALLLTDDHMKTLFTIGRARFWDNDAGLPAILILRERLCEPMAQMLISNINRNKGDWEFSTAIDVMLEISQESYNFTQLSILMHIVISCGDVLNKEHRDKLERHILTYQDANLIIQFLSKFCADIQLGYTQYFHIVIQFIYSLCRHYELAVVMEGSHLRVMGRIQASIILPNIEVIKDYTRDYLTALRDKHDIDVNERLITSKSGLQLEICREYKNFLADRNNAVNSFTDPNKLKILSSLSKFLPPPDLMEQELNKEFEKLDDGYLPSKDTLAAQVAVLQAFGRSLLFVDKYLHRHSLKYKNTKLSFWDCDGGIAATAFLGNDFGQGTYEYLKYCYSCRSFCQSYVINALQILGASKLSASDAVKFFLKTVLVIEIDDKSLLNTHGKNFVKILRGFNQLVLVQEFIHLLQCSSITRHERLKLQLLIKANWKNDVQTSLKNGIGQAGITRAPASVLFQVNNRFSLDDTIIECNRGRSHSI